MCEEAWTYDARVGVRAFSHDASVWRRIHHFYVRGVPYGGGRPQVHAESYLPADGGSGNDTGCRATMLSLIADGAW